MGIPEAISRVSNWLLSPPRQSLLSANLSQIVLLDLLGVCTENVIAVIHQKKKSVWVKFARWCIGESENFDTDSKFFSTKTLTRPD